MRKLVVYESMWGNSRKVAEAIAEGLGQDATVVSVHDAIAEPGDVGLVVAGGPTHMHGMTTSMSRDLSAKAAAEDGSSLEPGAADSTGLREWLRDLPNGDGRAAASFDTRIDRAALLTGSAAKGIAKRFAQRGYEVVASESFFVEDSEGPLADGELDRARAFGASLRDRVSQR